MTTLIILYIFFMLLTARFAFKCYGGFAKTLWPLCALLWPLFWIVAIIALIQWGIYGNH